MTAINLTNSPSNGDTATVGSLTYTYNSTTSRWELGSPSGSGALSNEQVQDLAGAQLATNGSHTGISFAYDDSGDGAIDATVGTLNQNTTGSAATLTTPRNIGGVAFDGSADINLPGVNAAGTQNTTGSAVTLTTPREINGVAFNGSADITVPAGGVTVYATMALLVAVTGMSAGNMAYVTANNNLYMYTGSGWFKVATVSNNSPSAITGVNSSYTLATDGTATTITAVSTDPEGFPLTWSYSVSTGSLTNGGGASATVSQADNVFTITPTTTEAYAGTFSLTFSASDGTNAATSISAFTLEFAVDWTTASQQQKVQASDAASAGNFGRSVSVSDNTASILGIEGTYIFTRSGTTWSQQQKIQPSDHSTNKGPWGMYETDLDGETCVIGYKGGTETSLSNNNTGTAYVFTRSGTTWSQQQKLFHPNGRQYDYFGENMQLDGDNLIVSAHNEPHNSGGSYDNAGAVYIWTRSGTTWTQQQRLEASDKAASDIFGNSVAIDGDTCVIGAQQEDAGGSNAGAAYVFTRSGTTWSQQQKLVASDAAASDNFGTSVGISGDTLVVGTFNAGAAYVFTRSGTTWSQQQILTGSDATGTSDYFGKNVRIFEDTIMVTATGNTSFSGKGAAYIFTRSGTTWTQDKRLEASDAANADYNDEIDFSGGTVVMGANGSNTTASDAGAGYFFVGG